MTTPNSPTIGWIGTGRMGAEMVRHLLSHGVDVTAYNRTASKLEPLLALGARAADTVQALGTSDIVFVSVTTSADLLDVTTGARGLLDAAELPEVIVDCSTVTTEASQAVRDAAAAKGVAFVAAPVSGNPAMVRAGGAAIVASGPDAAYERVLPFLQAIAPTVVLAGPGEESRLVKLCHNLLLGMITQALVEVTALAEKAAIPNRAFLDFINGSVLASTFISHKGRAIADRDYEPTFTTVNLRKDFDMGLAAARQLEVPMPAAAAVQQLIQAAIGHGFGGSDYIALYELESQAAALALQADRSPSRSGVPA